MKRPTITTLIDPQVTNLTLEVDPLLIRQAKVRITVRAKRLQAIWRAMEWWHSGDSGEDGVRQELAAYRAALEGPTP